MTSKNKKTDTLMNRRQFMTRVAAGCAGAAGAGVLTYLGYSQEPVYHTPEKIHTLPDYASGVGKTPPRMVIAHGIEQYQMVKAAVDRLGGMTKFINPGDRVVIKPNVAWDRLPEQAANTNPEVVAAVARLVREARPKSVTVTDVSLNDPYRCFDRSGIEKAAREAGADIWIPSHDDFRLTDLKGSLLKVWPVSRAFWRRTRSLTFRWSSTIPYVRPPWHRKLVRDTGRQTKPVASGYPHVHSRSGFGGTAHADRDGRHQGIDAERSHGWIAERRLKSSTPSLPGWTKWP